MNLRERRLATRLLQCDVARRLDVSQAALSMWESGKSRPLRKYRKKLARLYKCTEEDILESIEKTSTEK